MSLLLAGYDYDSGNDACVATSSDPVNCGRCGNTCYAPQNGVASCTSGVCSWTCTAPYVTSGTSCVLQGSAKARAKKRTHAIFSLCPVGETACPIAGAASFGAFALSSNKNADFGHSAGGYECLDTATSLDSCGGCASTGQGMDCTQIAHSSGVGCNSGQCVIFSCESGYAVSSNATKCVRVHSGSSRRHRGLSSHIIH